MLERAAILRSHWTIALCPLNAAAPVDRYGIPPGGVRDLFVDYLGELKPGMDYASLAGLPYRMIRLFWLGDPADQPRPGRRPPRPIPRRRHRPAST